MSDLIKISDLIVNELSKSGVEVFFGVQGGAVVHLFDSVSKNTRTKAVFCNHEQSASFAIGSYAKVKGGIGAGIFTTGPGATNSITGLAAAWLDSVPCVFLSGQVRVNNTIGSKNVRQVGTQEIDIVNVVKPITNYAVMIKEASDVLYHLQKALFLSSHGRAGPVWIDVPVDIQWSSVKLSDCHVFDPAEVEHHPTNNSDYIKQTTEIAKSLEDARRPLLLVGYGVRLSEAEDLVLQLSEQLGVSFVTSWAMSDFSESSNPLNCGRVGIAGQRGANLAVQNCDFLLCLGSHLNNSITGTLYDAFARNARVAVVDIDKNELDAIGIDVDWLVYGNCKDFITDLTSELSEPSRYKKTDDEWSGLLKKYRSFNRIGLNYEAQKNKINSYFFKDFLSQHSNIGDIYVVDGGGTNVYSSFQSIRIKEDQKLIMSYGLCSMGSGLPEAIGASYARPDAKIYCFVGDGSFPFNMQELQLIKNLGLPIKIFVFNNSGYVSIRSTQKDFLDGNYVGSSGTPDLHLVDVKKAATCFDLEYKLLSSHDDLDETFSDLLKGCEPKIFEVIVSSHEEIVPRQGFKQNKNGTFAPRPLEDMEPLLKREEFNSLMKIPEWNG